MSQRTQKIASLLEHRISEILIREVEFPNDCLVTVMRAEVTPDLKNAKVFVSILPENRTGSVLLILQKNMRVIQRLLNASLTMKFSPRLEWVVDKTNAKYAAIDEALKH